MSIERLKRMKHSLMSCIENQMGDLKNADAHELGEVVDMVKDLAEAIYYCTVTEAMENKSKESWQQPQTNNITYYTVPNNDWGRPINTQPSTIRWMGPDTNGDIGGNRGISYYDDGMTTRQMGISPNSRKMYMEAKDMHKGTAVQMQELESYMRDLSKDITDMIQDSTPEEKLLLQQKLLTLANKIKPNTNVSN